MSIREYLQRHIVIVGILIVVAGLITASDTLHDRTAEIIVWTEGVVSQAPVLGMVLFVLLSMVSAMVALLWLGWLLGGILSFCVGRFLGRSVVGMLIDEQKIAGWERELGARSRFIHILMFQAAVPSEIPGYVLGILRYRFSLYLAALAITELPYAIATVYLGESFLEGESTVFILLGIAVIVLGIFLLKGVRKLIGQRNSS